MDNISEHVDNTTNNISEHVGDRTGNIFENVGKEMVYDLVSKNEIFGTSTPFIPVVTEYKNQLTLDYTLNVV